MQCMYSTIYTIQYEFIMYLFNIAGQDSMALLLHENTIRNGQKLILSLRSWLYVTLWVFDDWFQYVYIRIWLYNYYIYIYTHRDLYLFQHVDQFSLSKSELSKIPDGLWSSRPPSAFNVAWNRRLPPWRCQAICQHLKLRPVTLRMCRFRWISVLTEGQW